MRSGIYAIIHDGGKAYIGMSSDVSRRLVAHKRALVNGTHHCIHLQRAWLKYTPSSFSFLQLVSCPVAVLGELEELMFEQYGKDKLFNIHKFGGAGNSHNRIPCAHRSVGMFQHQAHTKLRISAAMIGKNTGKRSPETIAKIRAKKKVLPVKVVNSSGTTMTFECLADAARYIEVSLQTAWNCLHGKQKQTKGWAITHL